MLPDTLSAEPYCYLTTTGRVTGKPHTIEIWFGTSGAAVYMLAGGRERSDWVRNLMRRPNVQVRIGERQFAGRARVITDGAEDARARHLLLEKYQPGSNDDLTSWGREALPVAVDIELSAI